MVPGIVAGEVGCDVVDGVFCDVSKRDDRTPNEEDGCGSCQVHGALSLAQGAVDGVQASFGCEGFGFVVWVIHGVMALLGRGVGLHCNTN